MSDISIRLPFDGEYPVTQLFGENPEFYARFGRPGHNGVDFGLPIGTPVSSAARGKVIKTGNDPSGYGNYIKIQHDGFQTLYAHLDLILVKEGLQVEDGEAIGSSGNTGFSTGPHLHFELRIPGLPGAYNSGEVDPLQFIRAIEGELAEKPVPDESNSDSNQYKVIAKDGLRVRLKPSATSTVIGALGYGEVIIAKSIQGDWVEFSVYVHKDYLRPR